MRLVLTMALSLAGACAVAADAADTIAFTCKAEDQQHNARTLISGRYSLAGDVYTVLGQLEVSLVVDGEELSGDGKAQRRFGAWPAEASSKFNVFTLTARASKNFFFTITHREGEPKGVAILFSVEDDQGKVATLPFTGGQCRFR